jgi:hypothetical protein
MSGYYTQKVVAVEFEGAGYVEVIGTLEDGSRACLFT